MKLGINLIARKLNPVILELWCIKLSMHPAVCLIVFVSVLAMERPAKLARLEHFRRSKPRCSASAMASILRDIATHGLPPLIDRNSMREARNHTMESETPYGPILQYITVIDKSDTPQRIPIADPFATLWCFVKECSTEANAGFKRFFRQKLLEKPPTLDDPWNIVMYTDEVTPGNVLAVVNNRKFHAIYWSFMELGSNALSREEAWFTVLLEFSTWVNLMHAGLSQVFKQCIKHFFQPHGFNYATSGILLEFPDGDVRLWARLSGVLQDGGAHKFVWHLRGDGASKFCVLCKNLFTAESNVVDSDGTNLLRCNCINLAELVPETGHTLRTNARFLASKADLPPGKFTRLQQALGLTYHKHALLLDPELDAVFDPCETYQHDSMHGLYVDGAVNLVVYLLFETFIRIGIDVYSVFCEFVSRWTWPARAAGDHLADIFTHARAEKHRAAKHIKCQASDLLSLIGVLAHFTKTVLMAAARDNEDCVNACSAFLALVEVCELIAATVRYEVKPARLLGKVHRTLELFVAAFGLEWLTPKLHWMLHYAETLAKNGRLFNCFCLERKHKVPKSYADDYKNITRSSSKNILSEVVCHHLVKLKTPGVFDFTVGLVGGRPCPRRARQGILKFLGTEFADDDIDVAHVSRINAYEVCHKGDVVLLKDGDVVKAGKIAQHFVLAGVPFSLVHPWTLVRRVANTEMIIWRTTADAELWETTDILAAVEHTAFPDGTVGILMPLRYRA